MSYLILFNFYFFPNVVFTVVTNGFFLNGFCMLYGFIEYPLRFLSMLPVESYHTSVYFFKSKHLHFQISHMPSWHVHKSITQGYYGNLAIFMCMFISFCLK